MTLTREEAIIELLRIAGEGIILWCVLLIIAGVVYLYKQHKIEKEYQEALKEINERYYGKASGNG